MTRTIASLLRLHKSCNAWSKPVLPKLNELIKPIGTSIEGLMKKISMFRGMYLQMLVTRIVRQFRLLQLLG